ncbi:MULTISPECIES: EAL and HDOD domain-containing protein [unclassified Nitratiruptor]|uniref:EAL and HDOD domain-containing protein n=1 Tax=unclassified Nitratiruptor TaxID=2624044 RepID=UPI001916757B|nr:MULTISPECIES: EAL domain-containing protein [unclassified Nitratiruptor]BCD59831.1 hypothetical protein NitYY0810_C0590 [Nitratiruptor sp. YY08-10]BCD63755.1 hypothetical protein NitYY0814_C0590 [Nitratiruptor sp. YY08-14]
MMQKEIFFARQSILDKDEKLIAYELLFRGKREDNDKLTDIKATCSVLTVFLCNDYQSILHGKRGFINVDEVFIKSDAAQLLPKKDFALEILEDVKLENVLEELEKYKKQGYMLILDDFIVSKEQFEYCKRFFHIFDIVKFDILEKNDANILQDVVKYLKSIGIKLLAEKVETQEQYEKYKALGFDYFQGYYFMKPEVASQHLLLSRKETILELWNMKDDQFDEVVEKLKNEPSISFKLLKLLNSCYFNLQKKIASIPQALAFLGIKNFKKWLLLMLYAQDDKNIENNPWFDLAKTRAYFMAKVADVLALDSDKAFLIGTLSVFKEVLEEKFFVQFSLLDEEIINALKRLQNSYGLLLRIVQKLEKGDFESWQNDIELDSKQIAYFYTQAMSSRSFL